MDSVVLVDVSNSASVRPLSVYRLLFRLVSFFIFIFSLLGCFSFPGGLSRAGGEESSLLLSSVSGKLTVYGPFDVVLVRGSRLEAIMPPKILEAVIVTQAAGITTVSARSGLLLSGHGPIQLLVGIDGLTRLEILTSQVLSTKETLNKPALSLLLGGVVSGSLWLDVSSLDLQITTPKLIKISGKVKNLRLKVSDMAHLDLTKLDIMDQPAIDKPVHGSRVKL